MTTIAVGDAVLDADRRPAPMIGVDTMSHGVLTAVRLADQRVFQSAGYRLRGSGVTGFADAGGQ